MTLTVSDANGFRDKTSKTIIVGVTPVIVNPARNEPLATSSHYVDML